MKKQRHGLTLVELVVVSGIGSILLALAMPALQGGREEANRLACLDNLRNIGEASHVYDDMNGELPPYMGVPGPDFNSSDVARINDYQLTYSLTQLLNILGYPELVEAVDPFAFSSKDATIGSVGYGTPGSPDFFLWILGIDEDLPGISAIAFDTVLPELRCPSDPDAPTDDVIYGGHPSDTATHTFFTLTGVDNFSITNYVANTGAIAMTSTPDQNLIDQGWEGFHSAIRSRDSDSVDEIVDGASNVVLFGESIGDIRPEDNPPVNRRESMAISGIAVGRGDLYAGIDDVFGTAEGARSVQFASAHPDVVNIVRADGSTQSVNRMIDSANFGRMCGVADGLPFFDFFR